MPRAPLRLLPLSGVEVGADADSFTAGTGEPWLELHGLDLRRLGGRLVEIGYRASLLDQPARPLIRFFLDDGSRIDRIAPAPVEGAGFWTGRIPGGTRRVALSPTIRPGRFDFRIEGVRVRFWPHLLLEGARRRPRQARSALLTRLIGWAPEADSNLNWAVGAFDFSCYADWLGRRRRAPEADAIDRPRPGCGTAPIVLLVDAADGIGATIDSLRVQLFDRWRLLLVDGEAGNGDPRIAASGREAAAEVLAGLPAGTLVARLAAGDVLPPHALAFVAEQRRRGPDACLFYGDETAAGEPSLKPGWSPRLMAARPYLGRAVFAAMEGWTAEDRCRFIDGGALPARLWADPGRVRALRRVLLQSARPAAPSGDGGRLPAAQRRQVPPAAIIIPTCDQPLLLRRVVDSIRLRSAPGSYRLVIVDNGRDDGPGRGVLDELSRAADVTVLRERAGFNFSRFCNDAVAATSEPLLVFLNDDMEVLSADWLQRLGGLATEPDVGAVGAKLTFPDGRLQHVGVLVGMGGSAGHLGAMAPGDDPGWLGRNTVPHEVSAVTGACLAVARDKFLAVGGFDAEALPVELSDVDLCLKLNARGWQTVVDPLVHLLHEESASRGGATFRRLTKYSRQRDIFIERWRHVLRDDPFYHPGLSLYSLKAALG